MPVEGVGAARCYRSFVAARVLRKQDSLGEMLAISDGRKGTFPFRQYVARWNVYGRALRGHIFLLEHFLIVAASLCGAQTRPNTFVAHSATATFISRCSRVAMRRADTTQHPRRAQRDSSMDNGGARLSAASKGHTS